ncbi:TetR/AcrR family transcriptional regulator [Nocardia sp. NBC_01503]|uniref:TetR/AcrR family transcriptional regulator n=1 Tax=Nocardia sp. NBC_01503 TaxID=2975997 RepID=UPI002E7B89C7|nr:TetR/AcrR family transcriptional regulator [Nocardia sp. NBC_01503]WTL31071.1 TetR/AcrR family transcriptional regulator [Nocardia sp. NBC_01503]
MGNREDLLMGARKAVLERGLAKVTARDIANAAGVSLAAIGYHFGSKDHLVMQALTEGVGTELGDEIDAAIKDGGQGQSLWDALGPTWNGLFDVIQRNHDNLLLSVENGIQISRDPEMQVYMAEATERAYHDMTQAVRDAHPDLTADQARAVAKLLFALFQGMAMQWMIAPAADLLDGDDLKTAIRAITGE